MADGAPSSSPATSSPALRRPWRLRLEAGSCASDGGAAASSSIQTTARDPCRPEHRESIEAGVTRPAACPRAPGHRRIHRPRRRHDRAWSARSGAGRLVDAATPDLRDAVLLLLRATVRRGREARSLAIEVKQSCRRTRTRTCGERQGAAAQESDAGAPVAAWGTRMVTWVPRAGRCRIPECGASARTRPQRRASPRHGAGRKSVGEARRRGWRLAVTAGGGASGSGGSRGCARRPRDRSTRWRRLRPRRTPRAPCPRGRR